MIYVFIFLGYGRFFHDTFVARPNMQGKVLNQDGTGGCLRGLPVKYQD